MIVDAKTRFYTTTRLGPKRHLTPEGFLVCEDVPIARTGFQLYGPDETPVSPGPGGVTKIWRRENEVFRPETILSFNGKPVVNDHPAEGSVTPATWKELAVGVVMNVRRGTGVDDDLLLADFMITDAEAIRLILEEGKDEVSCGYDAEYIELAPGDGEQKDILGNHVALVDSGRCGARCSIGDTATPTPKRGGGRRMAVKGIKDRIQKVFAKVLDEEMAGIEAISGDEAGGHHFHIHTGSGATKDEPKEESRMKWDDAALDAKFGEMDKVRDEHHKTVMDSLEGINKKMADATYTPAAGKTGDEKNEEEKEKEKVGDAEEKNKSDGDLEEEEPKGTTGDSAYLGEVYQDAVSMAEIIAPGVKLPVMDSAAKPKVTLDAICGLRRRALDAGLKDPDTAELITAVRGRTLDAARLAKMVCGDVRYLFRGVAVAKQRENVNDTSRTVVLDAANGVATGSVSVADINKRNAEFYSGR